MTKINYKERIVKDLNKLKVAIVCDWLTTPGGAEKVVEVLAEVFSQATIFTSVCDRKKFPWLKNRQLVTSWLDRLPLIRFKHQLMAPFRPLVFEGFDLSDYDLVISTTSAEAKNVITKPGTVHVCYCHTPIRYYWSDFHEYLNNRLEFGVLNPLIKLIMPYLVYDLRMTDRMAAERVDYFIANSKFVAQRIAKYYRRESKVIYPPVEPIVQNSKLKTQSSKLNTQYPKINRRKARLKDYYLCFGRVVPYKRVDLAVEALVKSGKNLVVAGDGPQLNLLKKLSQGKTNIELLDGVDDNEKKILMENCRGLIFPGEEDFGIVPVEAMMYGKPVVAFGQGGARETVLEGKTGVLFDQQNIESLNKAVERLEKTVWDSKEIRSWAKKFNCDRFVAEIVEYVSGCLHK